MLPRNNVVGKNKGFWAIFILSFYFCIIASAHAESGFVKFYQKYISITDGNRCRMYPSCSSYASMVIDKHGPVLGWVMACDRLVRCGRDEIKVSKKIIINKQEYTYDPVNANDFWWFKKEKK